MKPRTKDLMKKAVAILFVLILLFSSFVVMFS